MNKNSLAGEVRPQKLQTNHLFKIMRITLLLAFISVFSLNAKDVRSQNARVTLSQTNSPLEVIINEIENQTDYLFIVNSSIDTNKKVSIKVKDATVASVLNQLLKGTNVSYSTEGSYIILSQHKSQSDNNGLTQEVKDVIVTGNITDASGEPLIGVNVILKGTNIGTISDIDGNYSLKVPEGKGEIQFSYIGYRNIVIPIGGKTVINAKMEEDSKVLGEVVITAMGIERKAESLTYATQTVGGNELTRAKEANLINSLQGKSAGLVITPNSGGAGSASKILLRGNASILGNNSPLIVVDGVPMTNSVSGQTELNGGANLMENGSSEGSDALSQLNPDDIASITVLKGANSAALYGSAASNGVLMITTKKGQQGSMRVDVSSSTTFETPLTLPKLQNVYGAAVIGSDEDGYRISQDSWGGKLSAMTANQLNPEHAALGQRLTNNPYDIKDFYNIGTNFNNSVALSGGTEKVQTYFSYGNTTAAGIVPNNKFYRHNIALRENFSFFKDKLKINVSANYINQKAQNRPGGGRYSALANLYMSARNADLDYYKRNYSISDGKWTTNPYMIRYKEFLTNDNGQRQEYTYLALNNGTELNGLKQQWYLQDANGQNNPWWLIKQNSSETITNHVFGNVGFNLNIIEGLNLQARIKYDYEEEKLEERQYATTMRPSDMNERGRLIWQHSYSRDFYGDFMFSYAKQIKDFNLSVNAGGSMRRSESNYWKLTPSASAGAPYIEDDSFNQFVLSDIYISGGYGSDITGGGLAVKDWECAIFATAQLGYQDKINLEGSYRDDWYRAFTQFPALSTHYPYYSVGANTLLTNVWEMPEVINDLKVRISYSEVGNSIPNSLFLAGASRNPVTGGYRSTGTTNFENAKPETTGSVEVGFDLSMFNRAFNMDFTYYHALMRNQFMSYTGSTGKTVFVNAGKVLNQGVEVTASYTLAPNDHFMWKTGVNFSFNNNKIITTAKKEDGKDLLREIDLGNNSGLKVKFLPGGSYGDLYATDYLRDEKGNIRINQSTGSPLLDQSNANEYLGNMNAKYTLGWHNTFSYKNLQFYFLIDGKIGGKVVSFTEAFLDYNGVSQSSADARLAAEAQNLVWVSRRGEEKPGMYLEGKIVPVEAYYKATGGSAPLGKNYVYDGTNFRLREISIGYTFRNLFGASKNLTVSANARNLFFLYKDAPIDPETSLSTQNALGNVDIFSMPTTRSFGISLKATF